MTAARNPTRRLPTLTLSISLSPGSSSVPRQSPLENEHHSSKQMHLSHRFLKKTPWLYGGTGVLAWESTPLAKMCHERLTCLQSRCSCPMQADL